METHEAANFAQRWVEGWNAHDLEAVLSHFADDVVFTSPVLAQMEPGSGGVVRGKDALRSYWSQGLRRIPDLRFEVEAVYTGVHTVVIQYRNHLGTLVCEVLLFDGPLVVQGHGNYLTPDAAGASGLRSG